MNALEPLLARKLIVVTGKGGVGKSAVASALSRHLASQGRRTLVVETDPRENVHQMLGVSPSGGEILKVDANLYLQHLDPRTVLDQVVRERVRFELVAKRVLASPVYHHFTEGAPGLKELAVLGQSLLLIEGRVEGAPTIDTIVIDAPATGHGVSLLAAPQLVSDVIREGPIAAMTGEVADLIGDPAACGVVVVTLAEEMPVTEALELIAIVRDRFDRDPEMVVANGLYPPFPDSGGSAAEDPHLALWRKRRHLNESELDRLESLWKGAVAEVPLLPLDRGPELVASIQERLEAS
jgi:anion-transporting  ArsA/GET3 family ATPase